MSNDNRLDSHEEEPRPDEAWRGESQAREEAAEDALLDFVPLPISWTRLKPYSPDRWVGSPGDRRSWANCVRRVLTTAQRRP